MPAPTEARGIWFSQVGVTGFESPSIDRYLVSKLYPLQEQGMSAPSQLPIHFITVSHGPCLLEFCPLLSLSLLPLSLVKHRADAPFSLAVRGMAEGEGAPRGERTHKDIGPSLSSHPNGSCVWGLCKTDKTRSLTPPHCPTLIKCGCVGLT